MPLSPTVGVLFGEPTGQGWTQMAELGSAFLLSALIGLEREVRQKSAGLRTHTLVGVGAALFMLISKYGFTDVLQTGRVVLDPSRVAAQVVSGIGFIGGGLIFVRRDAVRGLTTAAVVWLTAAVGAACGAGLPVLAAVATGIHFLTVLGFSSLARHLPHSKRVESAVQLRYLDGKGVLRTILRTATGAGWVIAQVETESGSGLDPGGQPTVGMILRVRGGGEPTELAAALTELDGVVAVTAGDPGETGE